MNSRKVTYRISIIAILTALLLMQGFIPMVGYLTIIPGLPAITTIHLTVIIGAIILGTKDGALLGLIWGLISLVHAYVAPGDPLTIILFQNPIIAILPRVLVGTVAGASYALLQKTKLGQMGAMAITGVLASIVNTAGVIICTWLFVGQQAANYYHVDLSRLLVVLLTAFLVNAVLEMILAGIVTPIIGRALLRFRSK